MHERATIREAMQRVIETERERRRGVKTERELCPQAVNALEVATVGRATRGQATLPFQSAQKAKVPAEFSASVFVVRVSMWPSVC